MANSRNFGGAIWTNHALERLDQRGLSQKLAWESFQYPQMTVSGKQPGTVEYQRKYGNSLVTVIASQNDRKEWIILSCWIDPPLAGSIDIKKKVWEKEYGKASFWKKFWLEIKRQLGF